MILVTGATGHFGKSAIDFLLKKGISSTNIVALVRDEEKAAEIKSKGVALRIGDYDNYNSLLNAFIGVEKLLFVSGSDIFNRGAQHQNVVKAAKESGVKHVVYTSFQGKNETESSPLWPVAQSHLQTEAWLKESGIDYTILKNTLYLDFVPAFLGEKVIETGVIYLPAGDGKVGAVLRAEMAEATANILISSKHAGKTYHFTNQETFSYQEVAQQLSEITGKTINYISPTADEYAQTLTEHGVPVDFIGLFSSFAVAQEKGELEMVGSDLVQILGRKPTTVKTFLTQVYSPSNN
ncbi:MAG: SDR family oxidoreductase [Bacteroidetes bacterium]|jgi:NAD(P)H dehydrogenase (quinone)|nr:SDR family oxidoreductase [Bacteroidota bacterium]MCA6442553.1 SDR family oxidoreductase [Bacteroidota bacterium]